MKKPTGLRYNSGKRLIAAISPHFIEGIADVLTFGARKYARNNWMKGLSFSETLDSLERHLKALQRGEERDDESGILHIHHVNCNGMFLAHYFQFYDNYKNFDDRAFTIEFIKAITGSK